MGQPLANRADVATLANAPQHMSKIYGLCWGATRKTEQSID